MKKLLFIALSESQESYFKALSIHYNSDYAHVWNINKNRSGSYLKGKSKLTTLNIDTSSWLTFKLLKLEHNRQYLKWYARLIPASLNQQLLKYEVVKFVDALCNYIDEFSPDALLLLNGAHYKQQAAIALAEKHSIECLYFELGCLPNTTTVDRRGVNFNNSVPRNAGFFESYPVTSYNAPTSLISRSLTKETTKVKKLPDRYLFCPFQVHDDTQILLHSPWIKSMTHFYEVLERAVVNLPNDVVIVVKEHPTDKKSYPELHKRNTRIVFANGNSTEDLIKDAMAVITINSTVGIESLLFQTPVITLGNAFYNIDSLVTHCQCQESLNKLVAHLSEFKFNAELAMKFIAYLGQHYLVPGRHKDFNPGHIEAMCQRLHKLLNGE